jgi:hypothetical protein
MTAVQLPVALEGLMKATTGDGEKRLGFLKITQSCLTGSPGVSILVKMKPVAAWVGLRSPLA